MTAIEVRSRRADLGTFEGRHKLVGTSEAFAALTRIRSCIFNAIHDFFTEGQFVNLGNFTTPSGGVSGACEDPRTVSRMVMGDGYAILPQTGQQYAAMLIPAHERIWWVSKSFRAETSQPERRSTVFTMVECEVNHCDLRGIQQVQVALLRKVAFELLRLRKSDLETLGAPLERLMATPLHVETITYSQAITELMDEFPIEWGDDLKHKHEMALLEKHGQQPLFVTMYPERIRFWNMVTTPEQPDVVWNSDLLLPGVGETFGASQREHRVEKLRANLAKFARDEERVGNLHLIGMGSPEELEENYSWLFELEEVPHAGFGCGTERLVQWAIGSSDIRECCEIPRWSGYWLP